MTHFSTEQEAFWAGEFGDAYINRNDNMSLVQSNIYFFSKVFARTLGVKSIIEFGSNVGLNIRAIKTLLSEVELSSIEINKKAVERLGQIEALKVYHQSILDFSPDYQRDFVFIKGVLIHMDPDILSDVYGLLYETSRRYICLAEYYNPTPVEVSYRGHAERLFKRDFAGEMLDRYPDLELVDYGFGYHRDNNFPHGDMTWFLMEKRG